MRPNVSSVRFTGKTNKTFICYASVMFDGNFIVKYIKILKHKDKGIIIAMPSKQSITDEYGYEDIAHPVNVKYRKFIELLIMKAYLRMKNLGKEVGDGYEVKFREKTNRKAVN